MAPCRWKFTEFFYRPTWFIVVFNVFSPETGNRTGGPGLRADSRTGVRGLPCFIEGMRGKLLTGQGMKITEIRKGYNWLLKWPLAEGEGNDTLSEGFPPAAAVAGGGIFFVDFPAVLFWKQRSTPCLRGFDVISSTPRRQRVRFADRRPHRLPSDRRYRLRQVAVFPAAIAPPGVRLRDRDRRECAGDRFRPRR